MGNDIDGIVKWMRMQDAGEFADAVSERIAELEDAVNVLANAGRAANVISKCAQRKYGTFVVTAADVDRCDKAIMAIEANPIAAAAVREAGK